MIRFVMVAALLVAACKKGDSGPSCDKVVDHMQTLMKQMMPGHDTGALGDRRQMIAQCEQRKMPASVRRCIVEAKSFNDLATCQKNKPAPAAPKPAPSSAHAQPAPVPSEAPAHAAPSRTPGSDSGSAD